MLTWGLTSTTKKKVVQEKLMGKCFIFHLVRKFTCLLFWYVYDKWIISKCSWVIIQIGDQLIVEGIKCSTACGYIREPVWLVSSSEGVVLLENPKGDNRLDLDSLRRVSSSIFGTNSTQLTFFNGGTGEGCFCFFFSLSHCYWLMSLKY